jgi:hypothetical protein
MLPNDLCRRDIPELEEAITVRDYAQIEGLSEETVIQSIANRRLNGKQFEGLWYVEAPSFCEERLRKLHPLKNTESPYYILKGVDVIGPFTISQVRTMWNTGSITGQTMHCKDGDEQWIPLREILHLLEPPPSQPTLNLVQEVRVNPHTKGFISNSIICPNPNCDYKGPAKKRARGSFIIGLILCCFFILPGVLYFIFKSGYRYYCPKCNMQMGNDN